MASLQFLFGLNSKVHNNVLFVDENKVIYPSGHSVVIYNIETKSQNFLHSADNVSSITALALSNNKRHLAVAEMSDVATIAVYDLERHKKRLELKMPSADGNAVEIVSLDFSHDGKHLLAQGGAPTWTCMLWWWEKNKPLAQHANVSGDPNRPIRNATFHPLDQTLVCCSGNGVVKFFRIQDNLFRAQTNSLAKREPQNFLSHAFLRDKEDMMVASTDTGDIVLFKNNDWKQILQHSPADGKAIDCIINFSKGFLCGCEDGVVRMFEKSDNPQEVYKATNSYTIERGRGRITNFAISPSEDTLLCSTDTNQIYMLGLGNTEIMKPEDMKFEHLITANHEPDSSRTSRINGVAAAMRKQLVATCGVDRYVRVWNYKDNTAEIAKEFDDTPLGISFHPNGLQVVAGFSDKLRLMDLLMDDIRTIREFAISGCDCCHFCNGGHMFAAASGNMVQVIASYTCATLHTLRGLKGKVKAMAWSLDDKLLYTASDDGSIVQWNLQRGAKTGDYFEDSGFFVDERFKWSTLLLHPGCDDKVLAIGRLADHAMPKSALLAIKFTAEETARIVAIMQLGIHIETAVVSDEKKMLYLGSAEEHRPGQIRFVPLPLPDAAAAAIVADEAEAAAAATAAANTGVKFICHGEPVMGLALAPTQDTLFSVGEDGSLAIIRPDPEDVVDEADAPAVTTNSRFSQDVLVKKAKIEESNKQTEKLKKKVAELRMHNEYQLRLKDMHHEEKINKLTKGFEDNLSAESEKQRVLNEVKAAASAKHLQTLADVREKHASDMEDMDGSYKKKIELEKARSNELNKNKAKIQRDWEAENHHLIEQHKKYVEQVTEEYEGQLKSESMQRDNIASNKIIREKEFDQQVHLMEEDARLEIEDLKKGYESKLIAEREATLRLKGENMLMKDKHERLQQDILDKKNAIKRLDEQEKDRFNQIETLRKDIGGHKREIHEREITIRDKDRRIYDLKKKNQELEKFKFVLDYKIKELKRQLNPRSIEIRELQKQIKEMEQELSQYHKSNGALKLMISEIKLKITGMTTETELQSKALKALANFILKFQADLASCYEYTSEREYEPKLLKAKIKTVYDYYTKHRRPAVPRDPKRTFAVGEAVEVRDISDRSVGDGKWLSGRVTEVRGSRVRVLAGGVNSNKWSAIRGLNRTTDSNDAGLDDLQQEYSRQREYLERSVVGLKRKMVKDAKMQKSDYMRLMRENVVLTKEINQLRRDKKKQQMLKKARLRKKQQIAANTPFAHLSQAEAEREVELQRLQMAHLSEGLRSIRDMLPQPENLT